MRKDFARRAKRLKGKDKAIQVECLARIEGEAGLRVTVRDGKIVSPQVPVLEPPRLFEAFLKGRSYVEVPDITARICGICPVAHQLTAVQAIENAFSIDVDRSIQALRDMLYCGEWIASHSLHVFLLHGPDFLGYADGLRMAKDHPETVRRGLELKKIGNELVTLIGGREVHPVNVRIGGFYRLPELRDLRQMEDKLKGALEGAVEAVRWASKLPFPDYDRDYEFVALQVDGAYPLYRGEIVSSSGLRLVADHYEAVFVEAQSPHSHALHSKIRGCGSSAGEPLAPFNLNRDSLPPSRGKRPKWRDWPLHVRISSKALSSGASKSCRPAKGPRGSSRPTSPPDPPVSQSRPWQAGDPAARKPQGGLLYHQYALDENGIVREANIIPPTDRNWSSMEQDPANLVTRNVNTDDSELKRLCEQAIRSDDPCISCAAHVLDIS